MQELLVLKPRYGVFLKNKGYVWSQKDLVLSLEDKKLDENTRLLRLRVNNLGKEATNLNSFLIGEFEIGDLGINEILVNGWGQSSFSGYKPFSGYTKRSLLFLKRDQNPFSFETGFGYLEKSFTNEWYTQLVNGKNAVVIGAVTTKSQFAQVYVRKDREKTTIRITSQYDGLSLKPGEEVFSETIAIIFGSKEQSLETFANLLRDLNGVKLLFKPPFGLCCAYYHQGNKVDEQYVLEQLGAIDRIPGKLDLDYIQIDDGYSLWGDWLDTKDQFPRGMEFIVSEIKKRGLKAGIWIAPFVASPQSQLFKNHNNWFLKNDSGKDFEARFTSPFDFLPPLQFRVLDVTNPKVKKHLIKVIRQFVKWGFEFIKTDFTYPVGFCTNYHKPMTRVQAIREGFETIRKAAGNKVHIMSGITQLSPLVGLVDSVRVGFDTVNPFVYGIPIVDECVNNWMLTQDLKNCKARQFLNGKVWINDADCLVCKPNSGLSAQILDRHFQFIKNYGGSRWIGDNLAKLNTNLINQYVVSLLSKNFEQQLDVSVVIVTWNSGEWIVKCLRSLLSSMGAMKSEVFVVDNNSVDHTVDLIRNNFPKVYVIKQNRNLGFGGGNNVGIIKSTGRYILLLNPDTEINSNAMQSMVSFLAAHPSVGVVGPEQQNEFNKIIFTHSKLSIQGIVEHFLEKAYELINRKYEVIFTLPHQVLFLNLGCVLVRREIFEEGTLFDPDLFLYGEELDFFTKIRAKKWKVFFLRNCLIYHFREKSVSLTNKKFSFVLESYLKVLNKIILKKSRVEKIAGTEIIGVRRRIG